MSPRPPLSRRSLLLAGTTVAAAGVIYGLVHLKDDRIVPMTADYPDFPNTSALLKAADAVIIAKYLSSYEDLLYPEISDSSDERNPQRGVSVSPEKLRELAVPVTISRLSVASVLKGDLDERQVIEVSQPGGTLDGKTYRELTTPLLGEFAKQLPDQKFLLVLARHPKNFDVLNPSLGIYGVGARDRLLVFDTTTGTVVDSETEGRPRTISDVVSLL